MSFESYRQLLLRERDDDITLRPGASFSLDFDISEGDVPLVDRIFMTGETAIFYGWKTEGDYAYLYRRIDDSLTSSEARCARFALDMSADNFDFLKIAYHKLVWEPRFYGTGSVWHTGISVKAQNLKIHEGGYLHLLVEIRYKGEVDKRMTYTTPDLVAEIDIPEGSYDWQELSAVFDRLTAPIGNVAVYVEGIHYSGKVYFEKPYFASENNISLIPDFGPAAYDKQIFSWFGVNLSKVDTPSFTVRLNGEVIHDGEIFERCHRYSEWEFTIPRGLAKSGKNTLQITHTSEYRDAPPYNLHELGIVSVRRDGIIACPEIVEVGKPFAVLVKCEGEGVEYTLEDAPEYLRAAEPLVTKRAGLCVLKLVCDKAENNIDFTLKTGGTAVACHIDRAVVRQDDGVVTGTGDAVYINQNDTDFDNYLCWYFSNNIGNLVTLRPTYRWCGTRTANGKMWRRISDLLDEMGVKYVLMRDGRDIPGCNANPTVEELQSDSFLGRQNHELDGSYIYWGQKDISDNLNEQMFRDMFVRYSLTDLERMDVRFTPDTYRERGGRICMYRDQTVPRDMEALTRSFIDSLVSCRYGSERHTGTTPMFKYIYQAGYTWCGAELMYSSTEILNSALRGAAKTYGGGPKGAHLATQWSSTPHDTREHAKRYRLSLYTSYMQDLDDINTEEGLWRMEEYFSYHHRYSDACTAHKREQQDFSRYVMTHTRSGRFYTPVAFLHGRYDGWSSFSGTKPYAFGRSPDCPYIDAEYSWYMLDAFYPNSKMGMMYRHPCPTDEPVGYYSGTPFGFVDLIPIEAADYSEYPILFAVGYNKAVAEDMDKLSRYAREGGVLFIGAAQLTTTTDRTALENYELDYISHPFASEITTLSDLVPDTYGGEKIHIFASVPEGATVLHRTDCGRALIYSLSYGKGRIILLNTLEYAGNPAIYALVKETVKTLGEEMFEREYAWAEGDEVVQFTAYKQENGDTHFYFLSTDWYCPDEPTRVATLRIGEHRYDVPISYGRMLKAVVSGDVGAWFDSEACDVLEVSPDGVKVQGSGTGTLSICRGGSTKPVTLDFSDASIKIIEI